MAREHPSLTAQEYHRLAYERREALLERAARMQPMALSYRGFLVGCAALALNERGGRRVCTGINVLPDRGLHTVCAEMGAIQSAIKHGYRRLIAFAVVGVPQEDGESGITSETLPPCGKCRKLFAAYMQRPAYPHLDDGAMITDETMIFTRVAIGPRQNREPIEDSHTVHELLEAHREWHPCAYRHDPPPSNAH